MLGPSGRWPRDESSPGEGEYSEKRLRSDGTKAGVYATEFPAEESPGADVSAAPIGDAIEPTARVVDRLEVVHSFEAPSE